MTAEIARLTSRYAAIMSTMMAMGIFCDDQAMFDRAVNHFIRGPLNGGITHYVYPSGQCQESTRDHGHTQLGLDWMAKAARIAWTQGIDLFSVADNRLALGFRDEDGGSRRPQPAGLGLFSGGVLHHADRP